MLVVVARFHRGERTALIALAQVGVICGFEVAEAVVEVYIK